MADDFIQIEIAYANEQQQRLIALTVKHTYTIEQAIKSSTLLTEFPNINLAEMHVGIFSNKAELTTLLKKGDRIEIYRPLKIDPKQARRLRAKKTDPSSLAQGKRIRA